LLKLKKKKKKGKRKRKKRKRKKKKKRERKEKEKYLENWSIRVFVNCSNNFRIFHSCKMLNGSRNTNSNI